jgi:hypothetical protein
MPACAADAATDPFAASRSVFAALAVELGAEDAARLGHAELEDLLEGRGRELLRQLLQDHLDLRQLREEQAVRDRPAAVTGADGVTRRAVETGHSLLASIFGTVVVGRCAWRAQGRVNVYPADAALGLPRGVTAMGAAAGRPGGGAWLVRGRPPRRSVAAAGRWWASGGSSS